MGPEMPVRSRSSPLCVTRSQGPIRTGKSAKAGGAGGEGEEGEGEGESHHEMCECAPGPPLGSFYLSYCVVNQPKV